MASKTLKKQKVVKPYVVFTKKHNVKGFAKTLTSATSKVTKVGESIAHIDKGFVRERKKTKTKRRRKRRRRRK